jgi:DNA repair exonuclease SbcCD nuclease subunit
MEINLLVTGDLHLGRHPGHVPEELDSRKFSPGAVWHRMVDEAIRRRVDAVLVTGDLIDRENLFYEVWGPFEEGVRSLSDEQIPTYVVSGNHDAGELYSFVRSMDREHLILLGTGGTWERSTLRRDGEPVLHLDGWSYPSRSVRKNPLSDYDLPEVDVPVVGLLHTDLGRTGSTYAPASEEDLRNAPVDGWFLGHIHKPERIDDRPLILNPGSPQPLDPTETGLHGPWLVNIHHSGSMEARQLPLASLEYVQLELDVSDLDDPRAIGGELQQHLSARIQQRERDNDHRELFSLRVALTGRTNLYRVLEDQLQELKRLSFRVSGATAHIDQMSNRTRPALDLDQLSDVTGPVGVLAEILLRLERGDSLGEHREVTTEIHDAIYKAYTANTYEPLRTEGGLKPPEQEEVETVLEQQARALLDRLIAQKEKQG